MRIVHIKLPISQATKRNSPAICPKPHSEAFWCDGKSMGGNNAIFAVDQREPIFVTKITGSVIPSLPETSVPVKRPSALIESQYAAFGPRYCGYCPKNDAEWRQSLMDEAAVLGCHFISFTQPSLLLQCVLTSAYFHQCFGPHITTS